MKGDFSRDTFDPARHYSRVLMQQGRVQLDADDNEQVAILLHYLRALATDLIGPFGGPARLFDYEPIAFDPNPPANTSFLIESFIDADNRKNLKIGFGRYYVDGILCENIFPLPPDQTPADAFISYYSQADYPLDPDHDAPDKLPDAPFLVYLDVWERHITSLEDDRLREVALGGPDTATRARIVWQVKTTAVAADQLPPLGNAGFGDAWRALEQSWQFDNRGRLRAWTKDPGSKPDEACITPSDARYRGTENQLYRVEIHAGGPAGTATFKWSRDNGSIVVAWLGDEDDRLIVSGIRDEARGFAAEQWVELSDDNRVLHGKPGTMASLKKVEEDTLTVAWKPGVGPIVWAESLRNPTVRRWDSGAIAITEGKDIELEDGVMIHFAKPAGDPTQYRSGDYWLIPARVATRDVEWPQKTGSDGSQAPQSIAPHGITHHYAPLAVVSANGTVSDRRRLFDLV